jgi:hypothetical protein
MKRLFYFNSKCVLLNENGTLGELGSDQLKLFLQGNQRNTEMVFFKKEETDRPDPVFKQYDLRIRAVNINDTESMRTIIKTELANEWDLALSWIRDNFEGGLGWFNIISQDLTNRPITNL